MGIFVSYRRVDTDARAQHLYSDLANRFGSRYVFMDTRGIRAAEEWAQKLDQELKTSDLLLALIGPQWLTCTRDEKRRIDCEDDWVRNEIRSCLELGIPVVPVLLNRAELPSEQDLPADLRPMLAHQGTEVCDGRRWDGDVRELIADITAVTELRELRAAHDDAASARESFEKLQELVHREVSVVVEALGQSREVLTMANRQLAKLDVHKAIHDALHQVEFECLRPLEVDLEKEGASPRLRPYKAAFSSARDQILECLDSPDLTPALAEEVGDNVDEAWGIFVDSGRTADEPTLERLVGILNGLLSSPPSQLDVAIFQAANDLNLGRLVELMVGVRGLLEANGLDEPAELGPLGAGIEALGRFHDELTARVAEHSRLQRLDGALRAHCVGGVSPGKEGDAWGRIMKARVRIAPPFSPPLARQNGELLAIESEVDEALSGESGESPGDLIRDYFRVVGTVFKDVDKELKRISFELTKARQPLETVLNLI